MFTCRKVCWVPYNDLRGGLLNIEEKRIFNPSVSHRARYGHVLPGLWRSAAVVLLGFAPSAAAQPVPPISDASWALIGPTRTVWPDGNPWRESTGRIRSIAVDPSGTVYIGAGVGGVWKRVGSTWVPLTDDQPSLASGAIAIDSSHPNIIYVGTGEVSAQPSYYGHGILKSTDGGTNWTNIIGPFRELTASAQGGVGGSVDGGARFPALAVSPTDSKNRK